MSIRKTTIAICDVCGETSSLADANTDLPPGWRSIRMLNEREQIAHEFTGDLCPECVKSLRNWKDDRKQERQSQ